MKSILIFAAAATLAGVVAVGATQAAPAGLRNVAPAAQAEKLAQPVLHRYDRPQSRFAYYGNPYHRAAVYGHPYSAGYAATPFYQPVYYPACRAWARECAARWGWRTWRWNRCMRNHAC